MKRFACAALLLLALSSGTAQAQESPAAHRGSSWSVSAWTALVELVGAIFGGNQGSHLAPRTTTLDNDCGSFIDPTGGCRH